MTSKRDSYNRRTVDVIIPARGGSKRIPRKNLLDVCGLPLVAWSIVQARMAKQITRVWVSTDDDEIADVSEHFGAQVIRRPEWMWDDKYGANVPIIHAVDYICGKFYVDLICHVFPTNPLRMPGDMDALIDAYRNVPYAIYKTANHMIQLHHMAKATDLGDRLAGWDFVDKTGRALLYAGGCACWEVKSYQKYEAAMAKFYNEEHRTDSGIDTNSHALNKSIEYYTLLRGWAPMQWWQLHKLDVPEEVENVRELMEYKILKGRGAKVYD